MKSRPPDTNSLVFILGCSTFAGSAGVGVGDTPDNPGKAIGVALGLCIIPAKQI